MEVKVENVGKSQELRVKVKNFIKRSNCKKKLFALILGLISFDITMNIMLSVMYVESNEALSSCRVQRTPAPRDNKTNIENTGKETTLHTTTTTRNTEAGGTKTTKPQADGRATSPSKNPTIRADKHKTTRATTEVKQEKKSKQATEPGTSTTKHIPAGPSSKSPATTKTTTQLTTPTVAKGGTAPKNRQTTTKKTEADTPTTSRAKQTNKPTGTETTPPRATTETDKDKEGPTQHTTKEQPETTAGGTTTPQPGGTTSRPAPTTNTKEGAETTGTRTTKSTQTGTSPPRPTGSTPSKTAAGANKRATTTKGPNTASTDRRQQTRTTSKHDQQTQTKAKTTTNRAHTETATTPDHNTDTTDSMKENSKEDKTTRNPSSRATTKQENTGKGTTATNPRNNTEASARTSPISAPTRHTMEPATSAVGGHTKARTTKWKSTAARQPTRNNTTTDTKIAQSTQTTPVQLGNNATPENTTPPDNKSNSQTDTAPTEEIEIGSSLWRRRHVYGPCRENVLEHPMNPCFKDNTTWIYSDNGRNLPAVYYDSKTYKIICYGIYRGNSYCYGRIECTCKNGTGLLSYCCNSYNWS
nr:attachment protein [Avian metapneumovirus]